MDQPFVVVLNSRDNRVFLLSSGDIDKLVVTYTLSSHRYFTQTHYAKLVHLSGLAHPVPLCVVQASFLDSVSELAGISDKLRILGITSVEANDYVPIADKYFPGTGSLTLQSIAAPSVLPLCPEGNFTAVIRVVPEWWIRGYNGASGRC